MPPEVICTEVRLRFLHEVSDPTEETFWSGFNVEALRRVLAPLIAPDLRAKVELLASCLRSFALPSPTFRVHLAGRLRIYFSLDR